MNIYKTTKKVLKVSPNPEALLNGLTANSLDKPQNAFTNIHGRIISTFDQLKIDGNNFFIVIEENFVSAVLEHLSKYARLSKTIIEPDNFNVYFDLDAVYNPQFGEFVIPQKNGQLVLSKTVLPVNVSEDAFTLFRLQNNIPLLGVDYKDEMLLNVSESDFVSFTKGCFLGQEPIAKVHHRSKPTWKLVVKSEDECPDEEKLKMTSKTIDPSSGKVRGFIFIANI